MGGHPSKPARHGRCCTSRERAFMLVSWDAAFLTRMMRSATSLEDNGREVDAAQRVMDLSQIFAVAPPPVVDARRLLTLVEQGVQNQSATTLNTTTSPVFRWVRARLVLFAPEVTPSLAQLQQNTRLWRIFRRRRYFPVLGPRDLQAQVVAQALNRFQRHAKRHGPGVIVIVAGDGALEAVPSFATSLRAMLRWGHRLEVWSWEGAVPHLYMELAGEMGEGRVRVFSLNAHRHMIRYRSGGFEDTSASVSASACGRSGEGEGASSSQVSPGVTLPRPPGDGELPVAMPMATPVEGEGMSILAQVQGWLSPLGKEGGREGASERASEEGGAPRSLGSQEGRVVEGGEEAEEEEEEEMGQEGGRVGGGEEEEGEEGEEEEEEDAEEEEEKKLHALSALSMSGNEEEEEEEDAAEEEEEEEREDDDEAPEPFVDPLSMEVMRDPVLTPSGYSYERAVILEQIRRRALDPMTQEPLQETDLRPNRALREMIEIWRCQRQGRQQPLQDEEKAEKGTVHAAEGGAGRE